MNQDGDIDYRNYSLEELRQALDQVDRRRYPKNFENLSNELAARPQPTRKHNVGLTMASPESPRNPGYAGFWRRFGALCLDSLIVLPVTALYLIGEAHHRLFNLYYFLPGTAFQLFYSVYLVRRYGGTPGKLMSGLQIRKPDGTAIEYREAILRFLPAWLFTAILSAGLIHAMLAMTDSEYLSLSSTERTNREIALAPAWFFAGYIAMMIWFVSDFIAMMANSKRRALHDFIAGTVVFTNASSPAHQPIVEPLVQVDGGLN